MKSLTRYWVVLLSLFVVGLLGHGCGRQKTSNEGRIGVSYGPLVSTGQVAVQPASADPPSADPQTNLSTFALRVARGTAWEEVAVAATEHVKIGRQARIARGTRFATVSLSQTSESVGLLEALAGAHTGSLFSDGRVVLGPRVVVSGSVRASGEVERAADATITSGTQRVSPGAAKPLVLSVEFPEEAGDDASLGKGENSLDPGGYGNVSAGTGAVLKLTAGSYFFESLRILPGATLSIDNRNGAVFIYVKGALALNGAQTNSSSTPNVLFADAGSDSVSVKGLKGLLLAPSAAVTLRSGRHTGSVFAQSVELEDNTELEQVAFSREDCEEAIEQCAEVFGCPLPDRDMDGLSDCHEDADLLPYSDADIFNGVRTTWRAACHSNPTSALLDTRAKIDACIAAPPIETKAQFSGWDTSGPGSSDICDANRDYQPSWDACSGATPSPARTAWSVHSTATIQLDKAGYHCFGVLADEASHAAGAVLFSGDVITSGNEDRCYNLQPGAYPISWFYEAAPLGTECEPNLGGCNVNREYSVNYCFGGSKKCEPSVAIPSSMLRPAASSSGGGGTPSTCAPNAPCSPACPCAAGKECTLDQDCATGSVCARDSGAHYGLRRGADVCMPAACAWIPRTLGCGSAGSVCGFCENALPCDQTGTVCPVGEACGNNNGIRFGSQLANVCWSQSCTAPALSSCGNTESQCGRCACTPQCTNKKCGDPLDDGCGSLCPGMCHEKQTGCQQNSDCSPGLRCVKDAVDWVGKPGTNVCLAPACTELDTATQKANGLCGSATSSCGVCPAISGTCGFRICGTNPVTGEACGPGCASGTVCNGDGRCMDPVPVAELSVGGSDPEPVELELPGALPGQFQVNDKGKATYSVPIEVPPGRLGLQPALSLNYVSTQTNGPLGVGWSIGGLSSITRCVKNRAIHQYVEPLLYNSNDDFCLDGQRLELVGDKEYRTQPNNLSRIRDISSATTVQGITFGTPEGPVTFEVRTKDGRILTYGGTADSLQMWKGSSRVAVATWALSKIRDRAGNEIEFSYAGKVIKASVCTDDLPCGTDEHLLTSVVYGANAASSSDKLHLHRHTVAFVWESTRRDKRTGFRSGAYPTAMINRLQRVEVRTAIEDADGNLEPPRVIRDYQLSYSASSWTEVSHLQAIQLCGTMSDQNVARQCFPPTRFSYDVRPNAIPGGPVTFSPTWTSSVKVRNGKIAAQIPIDFDADGQDEILSYFKIENQATVAQVFKRPLAENEFKEVWTGPLGRCVGAGSTFDFNQDGRTDLLDRCSFDGSTNISLATVKSTNLDGSPKELTYETIPVQLPSVVDGPPLFLLDVNQDGLEDILQLGTTEMRVWVREVSADNHVLNTFKLAPTIASPDGAQEQALDCENRWPDYTCPATLISPIPPSVPRALPGPLVTGPLFSDVDGNGSKDLLTLLSTGDPALGAGKWYWFDYRGRRFREAGLENATWYERVGQLMVDLNGDGLKDYLVQVDGDHQRPEYTRNANLWLGTSRGFAPPVKVQDLSIAADRFPLDADRDGREDVLAHFPSASKPWGVFSSDNDGGHRLVDFQYPPNGTPVCPSCIKPFLADVDADGAQDFVHLDKDDRITVQTGQVAQSHLLTRVQNGLGRFVEVEYDAVDGRHAYSRGPGACSWPQKCLTQAGPVVARHVTGLMNAHLERSERVFDYEYKRARVDLMGRGDLGFDQRTIQERTGNLANPVFVRSTKLTYQADAGQGAFYPFLGKVAFVETKTAADTLSTAVNGGRETLRRDYRAFSWALFDTGGEPPFSAMYSANQTVWAESGPAAGAPISYENRQLEYDRFANVISEERAVYVADINTDKVTQRTTIERTFEPDPSRISEWLISLPQSETVTDSKVSSITRSASRTTEFSYYSSGLLRAVIREPEFVDSANDTEQRLYLSTSFIRNAVGNVEAVRATDAFENVRGSNVTYDPYQMFPTTTRNAKNQATTAQFSPYHGSVLKVVDPNQVISTFSYDSLGQLASSTGPSGTLTVTRTKVAKSVTIDLTKPEALGVPSIQVESERQGYGKVAQQFDAFGRIVRTKTQGLPADLKLEPQASTEVIEEFGYDTAGLLVEYSRPHLPGDRTQGNVFRYYDERLRLSAESRPFDDDGEDGTRYSTTTYQYATSKTYGIVGPINQPELARWTPQGLDATLVIETDPASDTSTVVTGTNGAISAAVDAIGNLTRYAYGGFDSVDQVDIFGASISAIGTPTFRTTTESDAYGRPLLVVDPNLGTRRYQYTAFGEVEEEIYQTPQGQKSSQYSYDGLGRQSAIDYPDGSKVSFSYDGDMSADPAQKQNALGKLSRATYSMPAPSTFVDTQDFFYEPKPSDPLKNRGLPTLTRETVDGSQFDTESTYDQYGRVATVAYPRVDGEPENARAVVSRSYHDATGTLTGLKDVQADRNLWQLVATEQGYRPAQEAFGNATLTTRHYDEKHGLITGIQSKTSGGAIFQDESYIFRRDAELLIKDVYNAQGTRISREDIVRDPLKRVTEDRITATNVFQSGTTSFTYGDLGNIESASFDTIFAKGTEDYQYDSGLAARHAPNAVATVANGTTTSKSYTYDPKGNQLTRTGNSIPGGSQRLTWSPFDLPTTITTGTGSSSATTAFEYDAFRMRVVKDTLTSRTVYSGELYERNTNKQSGTVTHQFRIFAGSRQVAQIEEVKVGPKVTRSVRYLHSDRLGSPTHITDETGKLVSLRNFTVFGAGGVTSAAASALDTGYTGHREDPELGLINMRGRIYDPALRQFLSADPYVQFPAFSQSWNRYSYVLNNPTRYTDPSGYQADAGAPYVDGGVGGGTTGTDNGKGVPEEANSGGPGGGGSSSSGCSWSCPGDWVHDWIETHPYEYQASLYMFPGGQLEEVPALLSSKLPQIWDDIVIAADGTAAFAPVAVAQIEAAAAQAAAKVGALAADAAKVWSAMTGRDGSKGGGGAPMLGSRGPQVTSKTVWKGQSGGRIDVENPNPGQRPGQIHFQQGTAKYLYDPTTETFKGAPRAVNDLLKSEEVQSAVGKAMRYLGEGG